jgi:hypothetical protein
MKLGWSLIASPLWNQLVTIHSADQLTARLLVDDDCQDHNRTRVCEALLNDVNISAHHGVILISGEVVLDKEEPDYAALMLLMHRDMSRDGLELLSRWAMIAEVPHKEKDVFHFPLVDEDSESVDEITSISRRRRYDYQRMFTDNDRVGCLKITTTGRIAA